MATADLLVELMFSWIEKRENCAKQLKKLADELETLREKCNAAECFGSTASVIGAAGLIGAGVATFFTGGLAAPLAIAGGIYSGVGAAVSVTTKIVEHFSSSDTLKDAEKIEKENNKIAEKIQNLFKQLKAEVRRMYPSADPDQVDRHVMTSFMGAVARRSGLKLNIDFSRYESFFRTELEIRQVSIDPYAMAAGLTIVCGIFSVFSLKTVGKQSKFLIAEATKQLIKEMSAAGLKTALKGGAMVVGGAVGMGFALPEAIDNWKDLIKKNHETKASRSLRDTASDILTMCRTLKKQFDNMRRVLEEMDRRQREEELMARRQREEELMARRRREEELMARRRREEEVMAKRRKEEEERARKQMEEEEKEKARRQREEEVMARRRREEELMARRRREEEVMAKRRKEEEEKARTQIKQMEEEEKEKARRQREEEVMARRRREEELMARRRREEEVMAKRRKEEEEKARTQMEEEEKEKARRQREEEVMARRRKEEEEQARKQIEEEKEKEKARRRQEYETLIRQQKPKEKLLGKKNNQQRQNPVQEKSVNLPTQTDQRHVTKKCDQSEQTRREQKKNSQQTGGEQKKNSQQTGREQKKDSQQTGREQKKDSQQAEQTGGDQGDDEREDEDKERDQEEEESDSEEETEEEESDSEEETEEEESDSEEEEETNQTPPGTIRLGLLNTRSMNKRTSRISELITGNNLDVLVTTETWLRDVTADRVLSEASPEGFRFHSQVRDGRRGGGVANQFSEELHGERIHFNYLNIETFEFVVTVVQHNDWDQPVVIINLYHPPGYNQQRFRRFLNEFQSLLDEVRQNYSSIIVTGDFNIHVNKERRSYTDEFDFLLLVNNLTQHVNESTHQRGNTLDLVITTNVEISGLSVQDDGVSDHYSVYFNAKPKDTGKKTEENKNEEQKRFRKTEE